MTKLLLLGLDGVIQKRKVGPHVSFNPKLQEIIPGAAEAANHYKNTGWELVGVTQTQSVVAGSRVTSEVLREQAYTLNLFPALEKIYICTDQGETCWRVTRSGKQHCKTKLHGSFLKPAPGMLLLAIHEAITYDAIIEVWFVGNSPEDKQTARAANVPFCPADAWRDHFLLKDYDRRGLTDNQIAFLDDLPF